MTPVAFIRHGLTAWSEAGRIQGRVDLPLSPAGREQVSGWRLPAALAGARWLTSPLRRARETAALLGAADATVEPGLIEAAWGAYEGWTLGQLRALDPDGMAAGEARGLDFRPPGGGESPREVRERLRRVLDGLVGTAGPVVLVCHKGVIRAALSLATGWDFLGKPPVRLAPDSALAATLHGDGRLELRPPLRLRPEGA
ncbi:MAG TPA: histidine phosphatase family protein [Geminicoccaceae bacterium]|nr:histidine phosphatase family protein [Geminicoccaceae bacterium]